MKRKFARPAASATPPTPAAPADSPESAPTNIPSPVPEGPAQSGPDSSPPDDPPDSEVTRVGKIARLPKAIRDAVNHRLLDGEPGAVVVQWLNEQPEVQAVLTRWFAGHPISENSFSIR